MQQTDSKVSLTSEEVTAFCDACIWLSILYGHFETFYKIHPDGNKIKLELLDESGHTFFKDLQLILIGQIILQVCRLTDPPDVRKKSEQRNNLSVAYLIRHSNFEVGSPVHSRLEQLQQSMDKFRKQVLPARDRRISHFDREAALDESPLGEFKPGEFEAFQEDLQEFVNIFHEHYLDSPLDLTLNSLADELTHTLKEAAYYRVIEDEPALRDLFSEKIAKSKFFKA